MAIKRQGVILRTAVPCGMYPAGKKPKKKPPVKRPPKKEPVVQEAIKDVEMIEEVTEEIIEESIPKEELVLEKPTTTLETGLYILKTNPGVWMSAKAIAERAIELTLCEDPPKNYAAILSSTLSRAAGKPGQGLFVKKRTNGKALYLWED